MEPIAIEDIPPDVYVGPFHEKQRALGGTFYEDYGTLWTATFGDPESEYWSVRRGAALWDTYALVKFRLTGRDTLPALDRLFTRRLADAESGVVRYGMLLDEQGRMLDEATVVVLSPEEAYLFGNDGGATFTAHMAAHTVGLQLDIEDVSRALPCLAVQGPRSFEVLAKLSGTDFGSLRWFRCLPDPVEIAGVRGLLVRAGFTGELGYEFYLLDGDDGAERLWEAIAGAGAAPIGLDAIEKLRIEAGLLIAEEDYVPGETDPLDLGMERFIDFDGHDFVGRDAVMERTQDPPRRFVTLALEGEVAPHHGAPVNVGGRIVGDVRSADVSPRFGTLALAVVETAHAAPGGRVMVGGSAGRVHPVPIDDPEKLRPRSDPRDPVTVDGLDAKQRQR
ncbi:MAG: aminomethyltransferase family protein [Actinomycetota bacterium]